MVLKKSSFKTIFNNKTPLITNFIQSQKPQINRNTNNESKIAECAPKIRNVSNFLNIVPKINTSKPDSDTCVKIRSSLPTDSSSNDDNESNLIDINNSFDLENIENNDKFSYTHSTSDGIPSEFSNESFCSQSDDDVFKILIATDTHLGYKDDDMYLSNDSINTFHEVLFLADKLNVDCIFHSGDFFDQNKPSRSTMYKAMELLNKYCLGNKKPKFDVYYSNDDGSHVKNIFNDKHNVKMPIFMIHGNHDNPLHNKGLSPIDILNISGLVNYFGKIEDFNHIVVKPLLLKKGRTKIALYGLGWIKDERLLAAFQGKKIEFLVPNNPSDWICVLLFHQNRYRSNGPSAPMESCIPESYIPDFIDLIIWGHEHESQRAPVKTPTRNHRILQLGSSIRTSLIQSESLPKHVALLEVKLDSYKIYPIRLETVRPMIYKQIVLKDYAVLPQEKSVWDFLSVTVENLLSDSNDDILSNDVLNLSMLLDNLKEDNENIFAEIVKKVRDMPLVRLKVDYTGFPTINPKSFGSQFVGKVANPYEIIRFFKSRSNIKNITNNGKVVDLDVQHVDNRGIFDIIYENDDKCAKLNFFSEHQLNLAVQGFVLGMDSKAISSYVSKYINEMKTYILNLSSKYNLNDDDLIKFIEEKALERANAVRIEAEKGIKSEECNKIGDINTKTEIATDETESTCSENNDPFAMDEDTNIDGIKRTIQDTSSDTPIHDTFKKIAFNVNSN